MATLTAQISSLTKEIAAGSVTLEDRDRVALLDAARRLANTIETPVEKTSRFIFGLHPATALRIASELGIFDAVSKLPKAQSVSVQELAHLTQGGDELLILRVMRFLVALDIFSQASEDSFVANSIAYAYVSQSPLSKALLRFHDVQARVLTMLPEYLKTTNFSNPSESARGPFQYAFDTSQHHFQWLQGNPRQLQAFNIIMSIQRADAGPSWFQYYPFSDRAIVWAQRAQHEGPILVDVGGGVGHDLKDLKSQFPGLRAQQLILQDLPEVIKSVQDQNGEISVLAHDFFQPQPVIGARFYYLRTVLHDWPDADCHRILKNLHQAMGTHSILLLNEFVLPSIGVPLHPVQLDLSMMAMYSAMERTKSQWNDLLNAAGFDLVEIWRPSASPPGAACLIEAVPRPNEVLQSR